MIVSRQPDTRTTPRRLPVPGLEHPIGAGDALATILKQVGIEPCGGCDQRRQALNRALTLAPWQEEER